MTDERVAGHGKSKRRRVTGGLEVRTEAKIKPGKDVDRQDGASCFESVWQKVAGGRTGVGGVRLSSGFAQSTSMSMRAS